MEPFITQKSPNLIKKLFKASILLWLVLGQVSCNDGKQQAQSPGHGQPVPQNKADRFHEVRHVKLSLPSGKLIKTKLAITQAEQNQGLSGLRPNQFGPYDGLLFFYPFNGRRQFWMPDTYFNIDIIFLDKTLRVIALEKNVPHHPGRNEPPAIYRTKTYLARHVLEIKADSPLSAEIHVGTQFGWESKTSLSETESRIHQMQ